VIGSAYDATPMGFFIAMGVLAILATLCMYTVCERQ
jgi:hypothetical protein